MEVLFLEYTRDQQTSCATNIWMQFYFVSDFKSNKDRIVVYHKMQPM